MIKKLTVILLALALVPVWAGCGGLPKNAVAEVNGKVITREDLDRRIDLYRELYSGQVPEPESPGFEDFERKAVQELVDEQIIAFEAAEMDITVTDDEIDGIIEQRQNQAGGEEEYQKQLDEKNTTIDREKDQVRIDLLFQKVFPEVVKDAPQVSDEAVLQYYNENTEQFTNPVESRKVRHILVDTEEEANQVIARLNSGEDFAALAKELSKDSGTATVGGDLGTVPVENSGFVPEFEQAMNQLGVGEISGPVKSQYGYHVIKVEKIIPPGPTPFEDVKDLLKQQLQMLQINYDYFGEWLKDVREKYEVKYAEGFEPVEEDTATTTTPATAPEPEPTQVP